MCPNSVLCGPLLIVQNSLSWACVTAELGLCILFSIRSSASESEIPSTCFSSPSSSSSSSSYVPLARGNDRLEKKKDRNINQNLCVCVCVFPPTAESKSNSIDEAWQLNGSRPQWRCASRYSRELMQRIQEIEFRQEQWPKQLEDKSSRTRLLAADNNSQGPLRPQELGMEQTLRGERTTTTPH